MQASLSPSSPRTLQASRTAWQDALPVAAALLALLAWDRSGLDLLLVHWYGSAAGFSWREHWLTAGLMHNGARILAWMLFGALALAIWKPWSFMHRLTRRERLWWLVTTLLCAAAIPLLKHASTTSCPWSLAEFGGTAHYVSHWAFGQSDGGGGGCFPSGHASVAFSFVGGWFVLRRDAPKIARAWLAGVVVVGLACGWAQMMRGAHFASHTLWTAWICWALSAAAFHLGRPWLEAGTRQPRLIA